jgi:hypothetical protein
MLLVTDASSHDQQGYREYVEVPMTIEGAFSLMLAFAMSLFIPVFLFGMCLVSLMDRKPLLLGVSFALLVLTIWPTVLLARLAAASNSHRFSQLRGLSSATARVTSRIQLPLALSMAALLPHFSWLGRLWLASWWSVHFVAAAVIAHLVAGALVGPIGLKQLPLLVCSLLLHFLFLWTSNLYLVLAARAISPSPRLCITVWRIRYLIDAAGALGILCVPR